MDRQAWRVVRAVVILLLIVAGVIVSQQRDNDGEPPVVVDAQRPQAESGTESTAGEGTIVRDVVVRDQSGEVVLKGNVDLSMTLSRIDRGDRLKFRNDGTVFQNRERRLPKQANGYYREWVHPTPKLSGPGPQRVVTGKGKEAWYTPDHYQSFERVR